VRASKTVVRPGKKNGGTTLLFRLGRGVLVRFTVVRVHPTCERIGSFTVAAHRGLNRVPFDGRVRGRPLSPGTYRVLVHARGAAAPAAALTLVVPRGRDGKAVLGKARKANACTVEKAREIEDAAAAAALGTGGGGAANPAVLGKRLIHRAVIGAVKGVATHAEALNTSIDRRFPNPMVQTIVGLLTLMSACLGALVLTRLRSRLLH